RLARDLAAKYAKKVDTTLDGQSFSYSDISRSYSELAVRLEAQARDEAAVASISGGTGGIIVTGATAQDVYDAWDDTSRAGNAGFRW
ncbi:MAG: hypothetical protein KKA05_10460, partial [Alphaproteobacteria bacterium]|nr:hypothetical protein [Alphaproteobacteria bacterium]